MLTVHDLLEDKTWKEEVLLKRPQELIGRPGYKQWRVMVLGHDGRWRKKDVETYSQAFRVFKKYFKTARDVNITHRSQSFAPPQRLVRIKGKYVVGSDQKKRQATKLVVWKPKLDAYDEHHQWCPYCRRPTVFKWFTTHHNLSQILDPTVRRCTICGISERIAYYEKSKL